MSGPNNAKRAAATETAWRRDMGDIEPLLRELGDLLEEEDAEGASSLLGGERAIRGQDVVRRAAHLLRSAVGNESAEERSAWDRYAAAASACHVDVAPIGAAEFADALLEERRKRFARKVSP